MKRVMNMDDVMEGMYVTVLHGQKIERTLMGKQGPKVITEEKLQFYKGEVLQIMSVDLPYAVAKHFSHKTTLERPVTLDLREVVLMQIKIDYARALLPNTNLIPFDTSLIDAGVTIEEMFKDV